MQTDKNGGPHFLAMALMLSTANLPAQDARKAITKIPRLLIPK
jgi:hypothetical protein